ncbi:MAG TPA: cytosine deaminase [Candidatus Cloacimonas sp.]|jgi:tRNA(adenine34) deaminase|nr:tRNA(adenine34) deaminase [Candidatus Cloacimonadota bacterium]HCX72215.1 cytosine deaminase [Candidatus Cloacimonas sp.]
MSDKYWMQIALDEARLAFRENEVPIGAVLVKNDQIIALSHNRTRQMENNLAHAEKLVIEKALQQDKFLYDYTLYVTVEPCLMCSGIIIWSRVGRVVFGCFDVKAGAAGSVYNSLRDKSFNHHPEVKFGILETECQKLIQDFFSYKRK